MLFNLFFLIFAYLLGSIPFGLVIGRVFYKIDLRDYGSGNIGTTNAFRAFGRNGGLLVFVCDMLKAGLVVLAAQGFDAFTWHPLVFGIAVILGHSYSIFLHFKGGKAVASSFGMGLFYVPLISLLGIGAFFLVLYFFRMVSLASICGVLTALILSLVFTSDPFLQLILVIVSVLVIIRHRTNIERIMKGTESKVPFGFRAKK
ncbi:MULTISPECIES: glycerol-3-phosphate 1-O-acyltransferase PlsY [Aerococcus]|uniref:Glycerol-3-phosphate acyltransferase n=1 Tax=Aerococcus sanguinicola TaxID=119206 RepID=A0A5N1GNB6_9LACT|nr:MULTISPECIES: glycerol-3-phosphate 1-O-acyltransferase PlsY [Aerococcus]KAA9301894.1 glycerol-3-phosphate 1-O-acyltransferase PlsY [Aerococcus sanguinicola]MDK6368683.1 glycerol-3-phosphate 1-O-acyltransferase PlsY [Aerococcus sp. UMB9870]MDK6679231.1 glycerol-3-phosphate 1-O-acyltransferase PlsY [Aerococcus sp. UMB8608]MDK6685927.1 glycerol-3-phosphate 1-O-acyltransferase PlsY [Aerococcus sp. UMB8623]MDK6939306.1 glycerol-3-phosphate 1-O-acyltransferase PlsY [Aerococcus sp. UMB8487]